MRLLCSLFIAITCCLFAPSVIGGTKVKMICDNSTTYTPECDKMNCCGNMGGINYCDTSAGRYVCTNGYYSSCYCTRHAVMDLQKIQGCCLWQGGVLKVDETTGVIVCNNGGISEICSIQTLTQPVSLW
ncbi:hypothetical protein A8135_03730 [Legionella jamestowniensis]|uniref:Neurogenic locus notch like protein n=2 Tax=Legionella jamestowniensis TaxID=455 RepID=A0A0W0UGF8_9GAMM|nr:neurogenic locus notch like protein precursor [Legionella jamestowniensis]OCH97218.1 hypothetical protein A8135_03730 [Legionella jamestowniensis]SFL83669.1 hypothetical protein SAMN02746073_2158 [Legionella jamestowniensis DSM 19215]